jgi:hypothetical protein
MKKVATAVWTALLCSCAAGFSCAGEDGGMTIGPQATTADDTERLRDEVHRLAAGLRSPDLDLFRAAAGALAATRSPVALPHLLEAYALGDAARRRVVLHALGSFRAPGLDRQIFQASLTEPYLALRRTAAEALVQTAGRDAAAKAYRDALGNPKTLSPTGRLRATQLLAHVGTPGAADCLRGLLSDTDTDVVCAACEGLTVLGAEAAPELVEVLARKNTETAPAAAEALERLTGQKFRFDLVKWQQWVNTRKENPPDSRATRDAYVPEYGDPYQRLVTESPVDFVVVFDTTGSFGKLWPEISLHIDATLVEMSRKTPSLRLGTVRYRADNMDRTSRYLIEPKPLTRDLQAARDNVEDASFGGGSGGLHLGLGYAIGSLNWRASARRAVLVVGDTTPEGDGLSQASKWMKEGWEQDHIQFNCLYIRTAHGEENRPTYLKLAALGAGRFYEYDRAWRHFVDWSAAKPDPKTAELPMATLEKWLTPLPRPTKP